MVLYFRSGARIESAYGLAITITMLMTTLLISTYLRRIRKKPVLALLVLAAFGVLEGVFFVSSLGKFVHGGYVTVLITLMLLFLMIIWYRGTQLERKYSTRLKVREHVDNLVALHDDEQIPLLSHNLVYLDNETDPELMDRDILYSILDKDTKRARAYWFVYPLIGPVHERKLAVADRVRVDPGVFGVERRAAALEIQHAQRLAQQLVVDLFADREDGRFRAVGAEQLIDAGLGQRREIRDAVRLPGVGVLTRRGQRALQYDFPGDRVHDREALRLEIGEDRGLCSVGQITDLVEPDPDGVGVGGIRGGAGGVLHAQGDIIEKHLMRRDVPGLQPGLGHRVPLWRTTRP